MILIAMTLTESENEHKAAARLRSALIDCDGSGLGEKDIIIGKFGKPYIPDPRAPLFSITHSKGIACAACTVRDITLATDNMDHIARDGEYELYEGNNLCFKLHRSGGVGIDAEYIDPAMTEERVGRISRRYFTDSEREYIFSDSDERGIRRRFYRIWTMKESYGKYTGGGVADGFGIDVTAKEGFVTAGFTGGGKTYLVTVYAPAPDAEKR